MNEKKRNTNTKEQKTKEQKTNRGKQWRRTALLTASAAAVVVILLTTTDRFLPVSGSETVITGSGEQAKQELTDKEPLLKEDQLSDSQGTDSQDNELQEKVPQVKVEVDPEVEENEQKSVDAGHSPWKLDPVFVTQVFASLLLSPEGIVGDYPIAYEDITILENDGNTAIAEIRDESSIAKYVYLKRLIRQDDTGIWSVVGYDME